MLFSSTLTGFRSTNLWKRRAVNLVDARERLRNPNAMDIGNVYDEFYMEDVWAVDEDAQCYRCGGYSHVAVHCATPKWDGKGLKGSGKNSGKGFDNRLITLLSGGAFISGSRKRALSQGMMDPMQFLGVSQKELEHQRQLMDDIQQMQHQEQQA